MNEIKWDLDGLLHPKYLNKLFPAKDYIRLIAYMFTQSRLTEAYKRAIALNIDTYQVTTTEEVYNETGIFMLECSTSKRPVILIGSSDMLYKLDSKSFVKNKFKLRISFLDGDIYSDLKLNLNQIFDNPLVEFESDELLVEFIMKYYSTIDFTYQLVDVKSILKISDHLRPLNTKLDSIYLKFSSYNEFRKSMTFQNLIPLSNYFNTIYVNINHRILEYLLSYNLSELVAFLRSYNIRFKIDEENSSLNSLPDLLTLKDI